MSSRMIVDHPCKGMTKAQIAAFEAIAVNAPPCCHPETIDALLKKGVIERGDDVEKQDGFGKYSLPQYFVPVAIHMQWCEWCSQQIESDHDL